MNYMEWQVLNDKTFGEKIIGKCLFVDVREGKTLFGCSVHPHTVGGIGLPDYKFASAFLAIVIDYEYCRFQHSTIIKLLTIHGIKWIYMSDMLLRTKISEI